MLGLWVVSDVAPVDSAPVGSAFTRGCEPATAESAAEEPGTPHLINVLSSLERPEKSKKQED